VFAESGWPGQVTGVASMFRILGHQRLVVDYRSCYHSEAEAKRVHDLQAALLLEGFHLGSKGMGFLSTPMTEATIAAFLGGVRRAVSR